MESRLGQSIKRKQVLCGGLRKDINVAIGSSREPASSEIQCTDTTVIMVPYNPLIDPIPIRIMILLSVSFSFAHTVWYAIANNRLIANC